MAKSKQKHPGGDGSKPRRLKFFISCFRSEVRFTDEFEFFLSISGFEPLIELHESKVANGVQHD
jgi:hypothetical protein